MKSITAKFFSLLLALLLIVPTVALAAIPEADGAVAGKTYVNTDFENMKAITEPDKSQTLYYGDGSTTNLYYGMGDATAPTSGSYESEAEGNHYFRFTPYNSSTTTVYNQFNIQPVTGIKYNNLVYQFKVRMNKVAAKSSFKFAVRTSDSPVVDNTFITFLGGNIYPGATSNPKIATYAANEWVDAAVVLSETKSNETTYSRQYTIFINGLKLGTYTDAKTVVDAGRADSENDFTRIQLLPIFSKDDYAKNDPVIMDLDDVKLYSGSYNDYISFNASAYTADNTLYIDNHSTVAQAKAEVGSYLEFGKVLGIRKIGTADYLADTEMADSTTEVVLANTSESATVSYALKSTYFTEDFSSYTAGSALNQSILKQNAYITVRSDKVTPIDGQYMSYVVPDTVAPNPSTQLQNPNNYMPLKSHFTVESSNYISSGTTHKISLRGNNASGSNSFNTQAELAVGSSSYQDYYTPNAWNKLAVEIWFDSDNYAYYNFFINGVEVKHDGKVTEVIPNGVDVFIRFMVSNTVGTPVNDAIDNIKIYKGAYYSGNDGFTLLNSENLRVTADNKVYVLLGQSAAEFGENFAGDAYVTAMNLAENNTIQDGSVIAVTSNANSYWKLYTVYDKTFKVVSFQKNETGNKATAVFNNHQSEKVILIGATYKDGELVQLSKVDLPTNSNEASVTITPIEGGSVKFMLIKSYDEPVPYCTSIN